MALKDSLIRQISAQGPIGVDRFMEVVTPHYYANNVAIGAKGDFITAPEISQLFGEMIGIWLADTWMKLGQPAQCALLECGPGRGTLMSDILRATKHVPGFHTALEIVLLEASPSMTEQQKQTLSHWGGSPRWIETMAEFEPTVPVLIIGNEFLDALPIRQYQKTTKGGWMERVIGLSEGQGFHFGLRDCAFSVELPNIKAGEIFEVSPQRENFVKTCAEIVSQQGGAGLFIDYGHLKSAAGDTLQAVKDHKSCRIFEDLGEADITSHVDFAALIKTAEALNPQTTTQGVFLQKLGIAHRLGALRESTTAEQFSQLERGFERLVSDTQMGRLFKVFGFCSSDIQSLTGFE